jgi:hypothetical protein
MINAHPIKRSQLASDDAFILDLGDEVMVWTGSKASEKEKRRGLFHAQRFLEKQGSSPMLPISTVREHFEHKEFLANFH